MRTAAGQRVQVIVIMGVSAAGKTTVGRALATDLGWAFHDADDYHSAHNIAKMRAGQPLDDDDRRPWLASLRRLIDDILERGDHGVLACSALKQAYRDVLTPGGIQAGRVRFVYLDVPERVLEERIARRRGSFAPPELLPSQLATLEEPRDALRVDGARPVSDIVRSIRAELSI
jgi:gluconokinase